jgi:hypothetical protein
MSKSSSDQAASLSRRSVLVGGLTGLAWAGKPVVGVLSGGNLDLRELGNVLRQA